MPKLTRLIEALLFVSSKPLSIRTLARLTDAAPEQIRAALTEVGERLKTEEHGLLLQETADTVQLVTHPDAGTLLTRYLQEEEFGELTKPALETLTVVAYRGPITKTDLDTLRGVNCALILRNLLIRGLVTAQGEPKHPNTTFTVSHDFLRHLGLAHTSDLPDFEALSKDPAVDALLHPERTVTDSKLTE
jgi:segregation and condensation protein B